MEEQRLTIPKKKYRGETTVVSARLPRSMVEVIDGIADESGYNRNEILMLCLEFALDHIDEEKDK